MPHLIPAFKRQHLGHGLSRIARIRPGLALGPDADPAFGPLSVIDRATLYDGAFVAMHEHRNDEILSWIFRGTMVHEDESGERVAISATRLMLMNAGASFRHQESVAGETVEMLQIFVRPSAPDLEPRVQFFDAVPSEGWRFVAGPEGSGAPLSFRQAVKVLDLQLPAGRLAAVPREAGLSPWLYLMEGEVEADGRRLVTGDALAADDDRALPDLIAIRDATLVLFLVDRAGQASRSGTISGG